MRHQLLSFVSMLAVIVAIPATAAEIQTASQIDAVTVYPDSAMVTRVIRLDLPAGDSTLLAQDFPLTLDPSSLRVEGEGGARFVIGAVEARPPLPQPAANLPQIDKRIEALRDERAVLDGVIASAAARRKFAERFAETSPTGVGEKGEARPIGEWRLAFTAVAEEIATADNAIRDARIKQRDLDREIARLEAERNATPPKKMEVRIDLSADAAASALIRVTYAVRAGRPPMTPASTPAARTASPRSNSSAAPRSYRRPARTGRTSRCRSPPSASRRVAARPSCDPGSCAIRRPCLGGWSKVRPMRLRPARSCRTRLPEGAAPRRPRNGRPRWKRTASR
jgi:uncharacterized protein DUF4140